MLNSKIIGSLLAFMLLAACASAPEESFPFTADDAAAYEAAQIRIKTLEREVARLESENTRMAKMLDDLQGGDLIASADASGLTKNAVQLPPAPEIRVPDSKSQAKAVVDGANAPELADADVPVEDAPRLVQPTFASTETVFENEATDEIKTESVLFGVHLASYRHEEDAREGWRKLQRENPDELGLLEPRIEPVTIPDKGDFLRLVGGGFSSAEKAEALCAKLKQKGLFCSVVGFNGARLSFGE